VRGILVGDDERPPGVRAFRRRRNGDRRRPRHRAARRHRRPGRPVGGCRGSVPRPASRRRGPSRDRGTAVRRCDTCRTAGRRHSARAIRPRTDRTRGRRSPCVVVEPAHRRCRRWRAWLGRRGTHRSRPCTTTTSRECLAHGAAHGPRVASHINWGAARSARTTCRRRRGDRRRGRRAGAAVAARGPDGDAEHPDSGRSDTDRHIDRWVGADLAIRRCGVGRPDHRGGGRRGAPRPSAGMRRWVLPRRRHRERGRCAARPGRCIGCRRRGDRWLRGSGRCARHRGIRGGRPARHRRLRQTTLALAKRRRRTARASV